MNPVTVTVNGREHQVAGGSSVADLLTALGVSATAVVVERNGAVVTHDRHVSEELQDGDRLELVRFVGGG